MNQQSGDFLARCAGKLPDRYMNYEGLTHESVEGQRLKFGNNNTDDIKKDTLWFRLRRAFINPFSVVLMVLAAISFLVDIVFAPDTDRNCTTVIIISVMLFISGCVRLIQELKSKKITDKLIKIVDTGVTVKRDGQWKNLDISELVVGDKVKFTAGERISADIRIIKVRNCFISQSAITGESEVQEKSAEPLTGKPEKIRDYKNIAFCGTNVVSGSFEGIVIAAGKKTVYGEIKPASEKHRQGYNQGANSIAWVLIRFMTLLVPLVFIASGLTKDNWISAFLFALSVAVGLMPELLPMVITACLAKGSFSMNRKQTVVKNVNAMQEFGSMDVLCIDKTGTLTEDEMSVEYYMDILGNEDRRVLDCAYLNSFYHSGICNHLDSAILKVKHMGAGQTHYSEIVGKYKKLDELPFDYNRRISSVLLSNSNKNFIIAKGSADDILKHCSSAFYKGNFLPADKDCYLSMHEIVDDMLEDGMKVLAVAAKELDKDGMNPDDEYDMTMLGYIAFFDAPKKSAAGAVKKLNSLNVQTKVLTGDSTAVAISVCTRLGIDADRIMTGKELESLSDNDKQVKIENTVIFTELSPAQKAQITEVLQSNGHTVGFLADGMNDLPAVLKSDVGICVDTAVPACKECADVILLKKDLDVLESGITEGRRAFANMTKYVKITASSNLGNIIAIVFASVFLPFFPMTSVQILLLNLLYDILCLVLPWDNVDSETVKKPLEWSGKTLSRFMLVFGSVSSVFDIITFVFLFRFLCPSVCGGMYAALDAPMQEYFISLFQTGWFLESMWTQVLILHLLRTDKVPFIGSRASAPVLAATLSGIAAFTLLAITPAGSIAGMTALPYYYFIFLIVNVICYLFVVTLAKQIYIKRYHSLI